MSVNILPQKHKKVLKVGNKVVGYLEDNRFIKSVIGSKHQLRSPAAWAIDAEVFDGDIKPNATEIVVIDKETRIKYRTSVDSFDRLKGELDRGFGRQYFLTLTHWKIESNGNTQLELALFGGPMQ